MTNDNYVIDSDRNMAWDNPSEAIKWYQAELKRLEAERDEYKWMYEGLCK